MDADALERRRLALEKMDNAKFSWYHVRYLAFYFFTYLLIECRAIIVAGVGL